MRGGGSGPRRAASPEPEVSDDLEPTPERSADAVETDDTLEPVTPARRRDRSATAVEKSLGRKVVDGVREFVVIVVVALLVATLIKTFLAQMFVIPSQSMEQTLQRDDRVMVLKVGGYARGDIVVFQDDLGWLPPEEPPGAGRRALEFIGVLPASGNQYLIKRLIGLPGDHVACCSASGKVTVNGVELDESEYLYLNPDGTTVRPSEIAFDVVVPEGRIFVLGDHRNASADSRYHLCDVSRGAKGSSAFPALKSIQGPAKANVFPFNRSTTFSVPDVFAGVPPPSQPGPAVAQVQGGGC